jgi:hypothetical protein
MTRDRVFRSSIEEDEKRGCEVQVGTRPGRLELDPADGGMCNVRWDTRVILGCN